MADDSELRKQLFTNQQHLVSPNQQFPWYFLIFKKSIYLKYV